MELDMHNFEILTDDAEKPAMAGDDIRLDFDLTNNYRHHQA